jgi:hypothetical protein
MNQVSEAFCTQQDTSGGSSETGTKVLARHANTDAVDLRGDRDNGAGKVPERFPYRRRAEVAA